MGGSLRGGGPELPLQSNQPCYQDTQSYDLEGTHSPTVGGLYTGVQSQSGGTATLESCVPKAGTGPGRAVPTCPFFCPVCAPPCHGGRGLSRRGPEGGGACMLPSCPPLDPSSLSSRPQAPPESPLLASHLSLGTFQKSPRKTTQARVPVYFTAWSTDTSPRCRGWGVGIRTCTQNLENGTVGPDGDSPTRLKALCVSTRTCAGAHVCAHTCTHTAALDTETEARRQTLLAACLKYCNCVY